MLLMNHQPRAEGKQISGKVREVRQRARFRESHEGAFIFSPVDSDRAGYLTVVGGIEQDCLFIESVS